MDERKVKWRHDENALDVEPKPCRKNHESSERWRAKRKIVKALEELPEIIKKPKI